MRPFVYERAPSLELAAQSLQDGPLVQGRQRSEFLAGGTTLLDLMKLDVMRPERVIDITGAGPARTSIAFGAEGLKLGALVKMSAAADHPEIIKSYPALAQSLSLAASAQLRNMATLGGNVLQRTRCNYFRDPSWTACNKRDPGSGCAAFDGNNRQHAVLGGSRDCIAMYPGDFAQALLIYDTVVDVTGRTGAKSLPFSSLHKAPGQTPHVETVLEPGDVITGFTIPAAAWTRRSLYLKIRDRQSYEFALASAAVGLDLDGDVVRQARLALGGVATTPWRAREAEAALQGRKLTEASAAAAAKIAFAGAEPRQHNAYKIALGQKTVVRALLQAAKLEG